MKNIIAGCILAGGKNSRMGGEKKVYLTYQGRRFLDWTRDSLSLFKKIYLSVECPEPYEKEELPLIADQWKETGPIGGIASVLKLCEEDAVLVVPCDMIQIPEGIICQMKKAYEESGKPVFIKQNGKMLPLPAVYTKSMLPKLEWMIGREDYRLRNILSDVYDKIEYTCISVDEQECTFRNINRKEEYRELLMVTVEEAVGIITEQVSELMESEMIRIEEAAGRVLAEDLEAKVSQPPFPRSPLDGYAIRACSSAGASKEMPVKLKVTDTVYAGGMSDRRVGEGEAVRIMTGAPIPEGADTVIMQEHTNRVSEADVEVCEELHSGQNYCPAGEDFREGDKLLEKGTRMDYRTIGIAAAMGYGEIPVKRRLRAGLLTTGDELGRPGESLGRGQIYNSNLYTLRALLEKLDVQVIEGTCSSDSVDHIGREIAHMGTQADFIVTTGGVSVGERDLLPDVFQMLGIRTLFHRVQAKPGSPVLAGMYGEIPVLSLSGNPFGALVHLELLVRPLIGKLTGSEYYLPEYREGILQDDFGKNCKKLRVIRARWENGRIFLPDKHASGICSSIKECNCLLELEGREEGVRKGDILCVRMM